MAQPTYEEGYKRAVEDTIREIQENLPISGLVDPVYVLNEIPRFIRKKLLTKNACQKDQEKTMPTYEEGYKRGVEDATDPITIHNIADAYVNDKLSTRRKKLLTKKVTKKVTKWTGIITSDWSKQPAILELTDTKEEIEHFLGINSKPLAGPIPIEIEVPL